MGITIGVLRMSDKVSILIVGGERLDRELLTLILNMGPFNVQTIDSSEKALKRVETGDPPDLVITHQQLDMINGIALIDHMKNSENWIKIPILVITSVVDPSTIMSLKKSGANAIISQPYNPQRLQNEVLKMTGYERLES
jgi:CheY-like chemotaxis protein